MLPCSSLAAREINQGLIRFVFIRLQFLRLLALRGLTMSRRNFFVLARLTTNCARDSGFENEYPLRDV